jgi:hypothetical protein
MAAIERRGKGRIATGRPTVPTLRKKLVQFACLFSARREMAHRPGVLRDAMDTEISQLEKEIEKLVHLHSEVLLP